MAQTKATVPLLLFARSHPRRGMHRWDLSLGVAFCSCRCREFTCRRGKSRKRRPLELGLSWGARRMLLCSCLLTRYRNVYLRCFAYIQRITGRTSESLTHWHFMAVNGQIGCCKRLNLWPYTCKESPSWPPNHPAISLYARASTGLEHTFLWVLDYAMEENLSFEYFQKLPFKRVWILYWAETQVSYWDHQKCPIPNSKAGHTLYYLSVFLTQCFSQAEIQLHHEEQSWPDQLLPIGCRTFG